MKEIAVPAFLFWVLLSNYSYAGNDRFPQAARQAMVQFISTKIIAIDTEGKLSKEKARCERGGKDNSDAHRKFLTP